MTYLHKDNTHSSLFGRWYVILGGGDERDKSSHLAVFLFIYFFCV